MKLHDSVASQGHMIDQTTAEYEDIVVQLEMLFVHDFISFI